MTAWPALTSTRSGALAKISANSDYSMHRTVNKRWPNKQQKRTEHLQQRLLIDERRVAGDLEHAHHHEHLPYARNEQTINNASCITKRTMCLQKRGPFCASGQVQLTVLPMCTL